MVYGHATRKEAGAATLNQRCKDGQTALDLVQVRLSGQRGKVTAKERRALLAAVQILRRAGARGGGPRPVARQAPRPAENEQAKIVRGRAICDKADKLLADGKPAEALPFYQEALKLLPQSARAKRGVGDCRAALGGNTQ